jgi:nitroreductase
VEALKAIMTRRSVRRYTEKKPAEDEVLTLLEAAMQAPSAHNHQPWYFVVIDERELLDAVPAFHPYAKMLFGAPLAVMVCADTERVDKFGYAVQDCSAATENLLLAAHALGLGAVWLGIYPREERMAGMKDLLGLPDTILPFALVALGYPAETGEKARRFKAERVFRNKWGRSD